MRLIFTVLIFLLIWTGCQNERQALPKPRVFPKVEYPEKVYRPFNMESCPFTFSYPIYAEIEKDKYFFGEDPPHPCWFDIHFPAFNASIYASYYSIDRPEEYRDLVNDSYEIASQINRRSDFMQEIPFGNRSDVMGIVFDFEGPAASPMHFYITDSTDHFFKGALYFNTEINVDSLMPVAGFLERDIARLIESFQWK